MPNKYYFYNMKNPNAGPILKVDETTPCCSRVCCCGDGRPISAVVMHTNGYPFLRLVKNCAVPCMCCNRPEMEVFHIEGGVS